MRKSLKRIPVGERRTRYIVTYFGETVDLELGDLDVHHKQVLMLRTLADQPELLVCGAARFQKMAMNFNGSEWVVEMQAVVDEAA